MCSSDLYSSDKTVPWKYTNQVTSQEPRAIRVSPEMKQEPSINDIVGTSGLTRSGRYYAPGPLGVKEREEGIEQSDVEVTVSKKKGKESLNELVTKTEANEFFKFIKHSEYIIFEQLYKLSAKISLLALMLHFEPHRKVMLKVLKQAYVPHNAPIDKIDRLVRNIMMDNYISFSDDEIPPNGHGSTKALHITTKV